MSKKLTIEYIKEQFEKEGYRLLSKEYINDKQKLDYVCPKGYKDIVSWHSWQSGHRCPTCFYIRMRGNGNTSWKNYSKKGLKKLYNYKAHVWQLTNHNYRKYKNIINPLNLGRSRSKYSLDHIYSVIDGFNNSILPEIIANPNNLQMLLEYANILKRDISDISLEELYNKYNNWRKKNAVQFS
jgi:hypothetical protein